MTTTLVANRAFALLELTLQPGQPIPEDTWSRAPEQNRRAMVRTKFVVRPDEYAGPAWAPATVKPRTQRGRKK